VLEHWNGRKLALKEAGGREGEDFTIGNGLDATACLSSLAFSHDTQGMAAT